MDRQRRKRVINGKPIRCAVFDILYLDGRDLKNVPLQDRKAILKQLFDEFEPMNVYLHPYSENPLEVLNAAVRNKAEGIVFKKLNGIYRPGKISQDQLKLRLANFALEDEKSTPSQ